MRVVEWIGRVQVEHVNFFVIVLFLGLLKKQNSEALSTAEAEYVAAGACCAQVLWMKHTLLDYDLHFDHIKIFCDNTSTIHMTKNANQHSKLSTLTFGITFLEIIMRKVILTLIMFLPIFNFPIFLQNH